MWKETHNPTKCSARNCTCFNCTKKGHVSNVCKGKKISILGDQEDFYALKCDIGEEDCLGSLNGISGSNRKMIKVSVNNLKKCAFIQLKANVFKSQKMIVELKAYKMIE